MQLKYKRGVAVIALLFAFTFLLPQVSRAAVDIFLFLDGIEGESLTKDYEDWIVLFSASTVLNQNKVLKRIDKASPALNKQAAEGRDVIRSARIVYVQASGDRHKLFEIYMENVKVKSVSMGGVSTGESSPTEEVLLEASYMKWIYYSIDPRTGAPGPTIEEEFNFTEKK